ncbi:MAG: phospholipase D-like domain-containing protein [Candidatus Marithrix sp.]
MFKIIKDICTQVGTNYKLEKINIISPYFSERNFLSEFKNCEISFVTDISCPEEKASEIKKKDIYRFAKCDNGILHAKIYLFHFKSRDKIKYVFLWGSANATKAGFTNNAEIYSWLEFTDKSGDYKELIEYFKQIDDCEVPTNGKDSQEIEGITLELQEGKVILPSLTFVDYDKYSTFDLWIQRGYLQIKEPTPLKFKISLELKKNIDSSKTEKIFKSSGTLKRGEPKSIILDYSEEYFERLNVKIENRWKSKFLNETMFGRWCSNECKEYILKLKKNELKKYEQEYENNKKREIEALISKLKNVVKDLGESATDYFEFKNSEIDIEYYEKEFCKNLEKNFNDAEKSIPKFISTSFLHSSPLLEQVVNTLIESIIHHTIGNKLASYFESKDASYKELNAENLAENLQKDWEKLQHTIINYYKEDKDVYQESINMVQNSKKWKS